MTVGKLPNILLPLLLACGAGAQAVESANGTATVRVDDKEYTIPIVCDDPSSLEIDLYTEPQHVTRERTGRTSGVRLTIRPWKDTTDLIVNLDRYVAWIPQSATADGILEISLSMSPTTSLQDGMPVALTYDEWVAGNRPEGLASVKIVANCGYLDPDAPSFQKLPRVDVLKSESHGLPGQLTPLVSRC